MRSKTVLSLAVASCVSLLSGVAGADVETAGYIESDLRVTIPGHELAPGEIKDRIYRLENTAAIRASWDSGDVGAMADLKLVFWGGSGVSELEQLPLADQVEGALCAPRVMLKEAVYV